MNTIVFSILPTVNTTVFRPWSAWSLCTHACFTGTQERWRQYVNVTYTENVTEVVGNASEWRYCNTHQCNIRSMQIPLFIYSFLHSFILCSFIHSVIQSFIHSSIEARKHLFNMSFIHLLYHLFLPSLIYFIILTCN